MHRIAKQGARLIEDQINGGHFKAKRAKPEQQAVLLRDAIKTPTIVGRFRVQIADAPVDEESAFVLQAWSEGSVLHPQVAGFVSAKAVLRFPAREVRIHEEIAFADEARPAAHNENQALLYLGNPRLHVTYFCLI